MVPFVMTTFGQFGPSAVAYLNSLADVSCSVGLVDRGVWLRIAKQYLSCALVKGRDVVSGSITRVSPRVLERIIVLVHQFHLRNALFA